MNRISNHTELLNYLADTFRLQSYLEIGLKDRRNNFDLIRCNKLKCSVDPDVKANARFRMPSDDFFYVHFQCGDPKIYDLIFIDGDHTAQQAKRDFENSLKCLTENGFIVIHDTNPSKEEHTHVPRVSKVWNGDVYKFACSLATYDDIWHLTADVDYGCTVVWKGEHDGINVNPVTTWQEFLQNKHLLNLVNASEFKDNLYLCLQQLRTA